MALIWILLLKTLKGMVYLCNHRWNWEKDFGTCPLSEIKLSSGRDTASLSKAPSLALRVSNLLWGTEQMITDKAEQGLWWSERRSLSQGRVQTELRRRMQCRDDSWEDKVHGILWPFFLNGFCLGKKKKKSVWLRKRY